jgi:hypothetical protein
MAIACAPVTIEATPILGPSQNSTPQAIGKESCASICASIDAAALDADSSNNDNANSSSRSRSQQSHFHQTSNTVQAMYAFYVCADEEDFIISKSFTSDQRFFKPSQT